MSTVTSCSMCTHTHTLGKTGADVVQWNSAVIKLFIIDLKLDLVSGLSPSDL